MTLGTRQDTLSHLPNRERDFPWNDSVSGKAERGEQGDKVRVLVRKPWGWQTERKCQRRGGHSRSLATVCGGHGQVRWEKLMAPGDCCRAPSRPQNAPESAREFRVRPQGQLPASPLVTHVHPSVPPPATSSRRAPPRPRSAPTVPSSSLDCYLPAFDLSLHVRELGYASPHRRSWGRMFRSRLLACHAGPCCPSLPLRPARARCGRHGVKHSKH